MIGPRNRSGAVPRVPAGAKSHRGERVKTGSSSERNTRSCDFAYGDDFKDVLGRKDYSRGSIAPGHAIKPQKIYVQHKMMENAA
jgi:hypothetical protein